ncbi:Nicotinamide/nicotinic acid mononucleotide adenylyltransferase 1 [Diplodia intermedia]|uniref:Nicotinamide/nicotinic acid mononucleotide adenylyltransferase 1 n=1 Tax=Diplodia intermedia TaxID=856260 RepID=A0ABR3U1C0_9PEZI
MCELAVEDSTWISVDKWEPLHKEYLPTANVLDHFDHELNEVRGGIEDYSGQKRKVRVALLAGADLIQTMSTPNLWAPKDLDHILGHFFSNGVTIFTNDYSVIHQLVKNDVSSTRIRLFLKRDMSIRYLVPESVIKYIEATGLYSDEGEKKDDKGKVPAASSSV